MRRFLFITSDFPPTVSGISTHYYNLLVHLPADKITVLAPWVEGCEEFDRKAPFRIVRKRCDRRSTTRAKFSRMLSLCAAAFGICMRDPIQAVHCGQVISNGAFGWLMKKFLGLPYYIYLHGGDGELLRRFAFVNTLIRMLINGSERTFTNSESTRSEFIGLGARPQKLKVVNPSVDPTVFTPRKGRSRIRRKFGLEGKKVVLTVARLGIIKGHDRIISAMSDVVKAVPNAVYLIAGSGPEQPRLEKLVDERGVRDHVIFAGYVPDEELPEYYAACNVFAMTSIIVPNHDIEGFGIVYLEASGCAKPVVGSRTGGIAEAVADGESGLLVDPHNPVEVAETLIRLLKNDRLARRLGRQGRARVERSFSWARSAARLQSFLEGREPANESRSDFTTEPQRTRRKTV